MENKEPYKITPKEIVDKNIVFRVPLYQRLFTWKTTEVKQLLEDLMNHFDKHSGKPYYLGMITVVKQTDKLDLIDGQQRTTVMMLIALGFIKTLPMGDVKNNWLDFFDSSNRVFFNGRSEDREYLKNLKSGSKSTYVNRNMAEGLAYIVKFLTKYVKMEDLEGFANDVFQYLTLFVTELPDHYVENPSSLNEYFEAMNSSGKSLEQHEILKVEMLKDYSGDDKLTLTRIWNVVSNFEQPLIKLVDSKIDRKEQRRQYKHSIRACREGLFQEVFSSFAKSSRTEGERITIANIDIKKHNFSAKQNRDKEDGVISFPRFLLLVLALHKGDDRIAGVHPSKLHDTFKDNSIPQEELKRFYEELIFYRLLLDMYVVRLKYNSSSVSHMLISSNENDSDNEQKAHDRLRQFQSMLDVSTEPQVWLLPFMKYLRDLAAEKEPAQMELLKFLMIKDFNRERHSTIPNSDDINPQYLSFGAKPRYWLWRLDYAIWEKLILERKGTFNTDILLYEKLDSDAIRQYEFRSNRSIEHLHPQNQNYNDEWPEADVNSFGNLAMISQSFNSQQSNLPVHVKFANLEVQIGNKSLQSLKLYFMYLKAKGNDAEWTVKAKNEHVKEMLQILKESLEIVKSYGQGESEREEF